MSVPELTYEQIAEHNTKKDLYIVIQDKIYNASSFIDEHPGGEEVLLDVGGQDATDAFEDVGHSEEARGILDGLYVGELKLKEGERKAKNFGPMGDLPSDDSSGGIGLYAIILIGGILAFAAYQYLQSQQEAK